MAAPAQAWSLFGDDAKKSDAKDARDSSQDAKTGAPGEALESSIHEAELLRMSGAYPEAIRHLSQLMLVAADDSRVIASYGKTLAAMGRAQEAANFLTRAQQLQPGDWTVYSALGVTYDQLGNQKDAAVNYERALALRPGEPSVLSNYALSRLLAKDPEGARRLIARAEIAGGASDPKIARNIAMVKEMAPPAAPDQAFVVNTPAPSPVPRAPAVTPRVAQTIAQARPAPVQTHVVSQNQPVPNAAPRPLMPGAANIAPIEAAPQMQAPRDNRVVMQAVPIDPLAGPVVKLHPPVPKMTAHVEPPKPQTHLAAAPKPAAPANKAEDLQARAEAIAKTLANKRAAIAQAKAEASKPEVGKSVATAAPRPPQPASTPAKTAEAPKPAPVKTAEAPKAAKSAAVKTADAKPKAAKDTVPALRMSANAY